MEARERERGLDLRPGPGFLKPLRPCYDRVQDDGLSRAAETPDEKGLEVWHLSESFWSKAAYYDSTCYMQEGHQSIARRGYLST